MFRVMARIDELVKSVDDSRLRSSLQDAVQKLRRTRRFGLVFEEHIPEVIALPGLSLEPGGLAQVAGRSDGLYKVLSIDGTKSKIAPLGASRLDDPEPVDTSQLTPVIRFGEPIYPTLEHVGAVASGARDAPHHIVIESENYHGLQLLVHLYERQVDCIYIDPPYNSGATDWKYNNKFIDSHDAYRHSKWLSMMEKRLRLASRLLKRDATLVVTVDENEVCHLGLLLEQVFNSSRIQLVTIVTNTAGTTSPGQTSPTQFSRADEYAYFCRFGLAKPVPISGDLLSDTASQPQIWFPFHRARGINDRPSKRSNLVYPIVVSLETLQVKEIGPSLEERQRAGEQLGDLDEWLPDDILISDEYATVWPILDSGEMSVWQAGAETLRSLIDDGFFRIRFPRSPGPRPLVLSYIKKGNRKKVLDGVFKTVGYEESGARIIQTTEQDTVAKTVWKVPTHDARIYGTRMLRSLIGTNDFSYPKSPYAVLDTLKTVVGNTEDALIVDFFAGSGTTLHSTLMLNELDGGTRRCILVTNNEVDPKVEKQLRSRGLPTTSDEWRSRGIYDSITRPRVESAITGRGNDGKALIGKYVEPRDKQLAEGFEACADFLRLRYLDPEELIAENCFDSVHPLLWCAAGSVGSCPTAPLGQRLRGHEPGYLVPDGTVIPSGCRYAVLLRESRFADFARQLNAYGRVTHTWLHARSETSFVEMRAMLPGELTVSWLFRDILRHFDREGKGSLV